MLENAGRRADRAAGNATTITGNNPIVGYVFGEKGLMFSASFEDARYNKLEK